MLSRSMLDSFQAKMKNCRNVLAIKASYLYPSKSCEFVDSLNIDELLNKNYCDIIVFAQQILIPLIYIFSKMTTLP